jgi:hypothetical protein
VVGLDAHYDLSTYGLNLFVWTSTTTTKKETCKGDIVNLGTLTIPLKAFGPPDELVSEYPGADLDKEVMLTFEELAACFHKAVMAHEMEEKLKNHLISVKQ